MELVRHKRRSRNKRQRSLPLVHIKMRDGRFEVMGTGAWYSYWRDPYHLLLTIPWSGFLGIMGLLYVATNALFALAYMAGGNCIEKAQADSFGDNFFFSVQTLSNIGYGAMYPKTIYANTEVMIESMAGILEIAVLTGLSFARFAQPTARVLFSRVAVIAPQNGVPTLMFRSANKRRNQILEAQLQVYLMRDECTAEGQFIRRLYDLKLLRNQTPSFTLSWTAMHPIDESSPLYGMTPESMMATTSSIVISLSGIDQTVVQLIHARHTYSPHEILWNHRFVDIFFHTPDGHRYMDYNYFHDVVPLDFGD